MVVDSSALVAIHLEESGYRQLVARIYRAEAVLIGAPTLFETTMVLTTRLSRDARPALQAFLVRRDVKVVAFTNEHFDAAMDAFLRFGKGRHPAALNFGDCMSYAVAAVAGMPLLYTGNDFSKTDITAA